MTDRENPTVRKTLADLIDVMAALRHPKTGCPWDLEQDFSTIAPYTIEEAYEVADAIARGDPGDLAEELGDLLLQVVYHARLAQEQGAFDFDDVADGITRKMIRRHPHVFGGAGARTAGMAKGAWERIKREEKAEKAANRAARGAPAKPSGGLLEDVPAGMPGLTRAIKLQDKAAKVGFDWPSLGPVLAKMKEEIAELEEALADHEAKGAGRAAIEEEFGDLLFVMANVARHLAIDPEAALRAANGKFTRRFRHIEARLAQDGRTPAQSNLDEMDGLWNEAKRTEKK
jgi:nucleoside triphosphate diphosphatase